jgi:hypothetical protein
MKLLKYLLFALLPVFAGCAVGKYEDVAMIRNGRLYRNDFPAIELFAMPFYRIEPYDPSSEPERMD